MRIALCSTVVPFVDGGARQIVEWLDHHLREAGHSVERVYLPELDAPSVMYRQMMAFRCIDLDAADRIICFRPQSQLIPHPHKVLWFIHHVRVFYDLWDSEYRDFAATAKHLGIRDAIRHADTQAIAEAKAVFTNSRVVSDRLWRYNGVASEVLYPPIFQPERFRCEGFNDEIVYVSRLEPHKRQDLLVEALAHTTTPVHIRLCGVATNDSYPRQLAARASELGVADRVAFENRWITEDHKSDLLAGCLAAAYLPADEDSYGYPTLEAAHSSKPVVTLTDAGGVLEFVDDGVTGVVAEPSPKALAEQLDRLYRDRNLTAALGRAATDRVVSLGVAWPRVVDRLLA